MFESLLILMCEGESFSALREEKLLNNCIQSAVRRRAGFMVVLLQSSHI